MQFKLILRYICRYKIVKEEVKVVDWRWRKYQRAIDFYFPMLATRLELDVKEIVIFSASRLFKPQHDWYFQATKARTSICNSGGQSRRSRLNFSTHVARHWLASSVIKERTKQLKTPAAVYRHPPVYFRRPRCVRRVHHLFFSRQCSSTGCT